jgi:MFS family permease
MSGWLSDRWVEASGNPTLVRKTFMAVGQSGAGLFLLSCVLAPNAAVSIAFLLIAYAFCGVSASNLFAITQTLAGPRASGKWTGFQNMFGSIAGVISPAVTGLVVNRTGHFLWAFAITALVAIVGSLSWIFGIGSVKQVVWAQSTSSDLARAAAETA